MVDPVPVAPEQMQQPGIPLCFAPEAPKLKKKLGQEEGPIGEYFKDFVQQLAQQYIHFQLDKLTQQIHRYIVTAVDKESKCLFLHCDFSQDLADAMADQ